MAQVKFVQCTSSEYASATKNASTLYFLTDTQQIFKGTVQYSLAKANNEIEGIASGDQIVVADASDGDKIKRGIQFNTSQRTKFLRQDGTWQTPSTGVNISSGTSLPSTGSVGDIFVLYSNT